MHIEFATIKNRTLGAVRQHIIDHPKKRIGDLRVFDLIKNGSKPLTSNHGVYMFFDESQKTCLYVGKNSSNQFIERIPSHFAQHENSWSNHFLKYFKKSKNIDSFFEAAVATENLSVILIQIEHEFINKAEKILRIAMNPAFNSLATKPKNINLLDANSVFIDVIK